MMPDREKVIREYEEFVDKYECFSSSDDYVLEMHKAVLALLKEQEQEIKFLKAMQLQTVNNMNEDDIGNAVAKVLGLKGR